MAALNIHKRTFDFFGYGRYDGNAFLRFAVLSLVLAHFPAQLLVNVLTRYVCKVGVHIEHTSAETAFWTAKYVLAQVDIQMLISRILGIVTARTMNIVGLLVVLWERQPEYANDIDHTEYFHVIPPFRG